MQCNNVARQVEKMLPEFRWGNVDAGPYIYTCFGLTQVEGKQEKLESSKRAISLKDEVSVEESRCLLKTSFVAGLFKARLRLARILILI